jgi:hypothetical protein
VDEIVKIQEMAVGVDYADVVEHCKPPCSNTLAVSGANSVSARYTGSVKPRGPYTLTVIKTSATGKNYLNTDLSARA